MRGDAEDDIGVPLERLHELLRVHVPKVGLTILRTGEDHLRLSDRYKVGKAAELRVAVAAVRLEALALVVVPQA